MFEAVRGLPGELDEDAGDDEHGCHASHAEDEAIERVDFLDEALVEGLAEVLDASEVLVEALVLATQEGVAACQECRQDNFHDEHKPKHE